MAEKENIVRNDDVDVNQVSDILGKILVGYYFDHLDPNRMLTCPEICVQLLRK